MNKENLNDAGTVLFLRKENEDIVFPYTKIGEKFRGGMFWCIPNQGKNTPPFSVQNGEYRNTEGIDKTLEGPWGALSVHVSWEEQEFSVRTTANITALKDSSLRPGLHPYFPVGEDFMLSIDEKEYPKESIPVDEVIYVVTKNREAILTTHGKKIRISYEANEGLIAYFCIWTDNKERYICIEPVLGKELEANAPLPFSLRIGETISITSVINFQ